MAVEHVDEAVDVPRVDEVLDSRQWQKRRFPFPHVVARDVFVRDFYLDLVVDFEQRLDGTGQRFNRDMPGFDASGISFSPRTGRPWSFFLSRRWHDLMCALFEVEGSGHVSGGLHHHEPGSRASDIHNDLNPGYFPSPAHPGRIVVADKEYCDYGTGIASEPGNESTATVRAVSMIFYLANPAWTPGDGGETGLYDHGVQNREAPAAVVPPHNNSLVMFESTPFSFHAYLGRNRKPRNALVLWTHRSPEVVRNIWSDQVVVPWT